MRRGASFLIGILLYHKCTLALRVAFTLSNVPANTDRLHRSFLRQCLEVVSHLIKTASQNAMRIRLNYSLEYMYGVQGMVWSMGYRVWYGVWGIGMVWSMGYRVWYGVWGIGMVWSMVWSMGYKVWYGVWGTGYGMEYGV